MNNYVDVLGGKGLNWNQNADGPPGWVRSRAGTCQGSGQGGASLHAKQPRLRVLPLVFRDRSCATHTPSRVQEVICPSPPPQTPNTPPGSSPPVSLSQWATLASWPPALTLAVPSVWDAVPHAARFLTSRSAEASPDSLRENAPHLRSSLPSHPALPSHHSTHCIDSRIYTYVIICLSPAFPLECQLHKGKYHLIPELNTVPDTEIGAW